MLRRIGFPVAAVLIVTLATNTFAGDIWDYEAVDALGYGTHPLVNAVPGDDNKVTIEGLVIGGTEDFVDRNGGFAMYSIWVQDDLDDRGGIQCWAGPWNKGTWGSYPIIAAGSRVRVSGWLANHNGKVFVNDRHSVALMWSVEVLDNDAGMPEAELIGSIGVCNTFDETRVTGGERWQTRWVKFEDVEIVDGVWGAGQALTISDGADNLTMLLSGMGDFDGYPMPTGTFDVVGVFDQEDKNNDGDFHDSYRLWVKDCSAYVGAFVAGDANGDGKIDGADLAIWQQNYDPLGVGDNNIWANGNWNDDNAIDGADLALWQQNYDPLGIGGDSLAGSGMTEVPEPATTVLLLVGALAGLPALRRRPTRR